MVPPKPPPHRQGKKHVCFPPQHSRGAHRIGMSADTTDHPGLPLDLGNWDNLIRSHVCGMCMVVTGTCYVVMTNLVTTNLEHGKHGGVKQGRVNKNWRPQKYILARTCHVTSLHVLIAYLFILIYRSIPYYTSQFQDIKNRFH